MPLPASGTLDEKGFAAYWFGDFAGVMLQGDWTGGEGGGSVADCMRVLLAPPEVGDAAGRPAHDWARLCLGSFYVKPNYPGRSSHVCNGGFLVTDGARNRGVGRLMGEAYLDWCRAWLRECVRVLKSYRRIRPEEIPLPPSK